MQKLSELYPVKPLQRPLAVPLPNYGTVLSLDNNDFHPTLTPKQIELVAGSVSLLENYLPNLLAAGGDLKNLPIRMNEWFLGLNYLNSYIYIFNETLLKPQNERLHSYHLSKIGGAK